MECINLEKDFTYFQWKTSGYETQANTFIEWCFERKCNEINQGGRILNEWRVRKQIYKSYIRSIVFDFEHYSQHDDTHSINILNAIEMVLGRNRVKLLSTSDLWLLLESAYFHDIGMALSEKEIRSMWKDQKFHTYLIKVLAGNDIDLKDAVNYYYQMDNLLNYRKQLEDLGNVEKLEFPEDWPADFEKKITILIADYVRDQHSVRSKRFMETLSEKTSNEKRESVIKPRLDKLVADISELHGEHFGDICKKVEYHALGFDVEFLHPQFVAAMLRLGDLLDMDNNRFSMRALEHFGNIPVLSSHHFEKHRAVYHFAIDQKQIEAKAYSEKSEVCRVTSEWFQWLEKEVENLICDWNEFAPPNLQGCMLQRCKLEVYHGETKFDAKWQKNFQVDQKRLLSLMTGSNIYISELDCLREYIQNALDASKMSFWLNIKNGKIKLANKVDNIENVIPFDICKEDYKKKTIEIRIEVVLQARNSFVRLKITDHGIGMESECVDSLSVVGRSWKNRTIFQNEISQMPEWLKPTGGFGIGLQSAFMLTDQVKIETKFDREPYGYSVELNSPDKGGSVIKLKNDKLVLTGTTVEFCIMLDKFYDLTKDAFKNDKHLDEINCFSKADIEDDIRNILQKYVEKYIPNSLFPIRVIGGKRNVHAYASPYASPYINFEPENKKIIVEEPGFDSISIKDRFLLKGRYVCNVEANLKVRIWDKKESVFCCVESIYEKMKGFNQSIGKKINHFCYRNVRVNEVNERERGIEYYWFLRSCIDFMGGNMENILSIRRNDFLNDFDLNKYYNNYLAVYIEAIHTAYSRKLVSKYDIKDRLSFFSYLFLAMKFLEKDKWEKLMYEFYPEVLFSREVSVLNVINKTVEPGMIHADEALYNIRPILAKELEEEDGLEPLYEDCICFVAPEPLSIYNKNIPIIDLDEVEFDNLLDQEILCNLDKCKFIYREREICEELYRIGKRFHMQYFRLSGQGVAHQVNPIYVMVRGLKENWNYYCQNHLDDDIFIKRAFWASGGGRYIAENIDCTKYNKLKVKQLPLRMITNNGKVRNNTYLISPINSEIYRKILSMMDIRVQDVPKREEMDHVEKINMRRIVTKSEFVDLIINDEEFKHEYEFLIYWVYKNQLADQKDRLEVDEVKKKYKDFVTDIYYTIFSANDNI